MTAGPQSGTGSAAEEAGRLFEAVQDWARRASGAVGAAGAADWDEHLATGSAECRLCPVCQLIGLLRESRPEVAGHLAEAAGSLLAALRATMAAHEREHRPGRTPGVERIDIG